MTGGTETDKKRLQHPATMTREQIVDGLRREKMRAHSVAIFLQRAIDELADDEYANWGEADTAVWLALEDVENLAAVTIRRPSLRAPTLHDIYIETGHRAVEAADPSNEPCIERKIENLMGFLRQASDGEVTP